MRVGANSWIPPGGWLPKPVGWPLSDPSGMRRTAPLDEMVFASEEEKVDKGVEGQREEARSGSFELAVQGTLGSLKPRAAPLQSMAHSAENSRM